MKVINISVLTDKIIRLGRRGEGNVRQIVFDCTCFEETYGSGTAQLLHWRRGDEAPYPVLIEQNDNIVTWTVQESDTANVGIGEAEIIWMLPDGNAKSAVYETETLRSLSEPGDPPEPWQAWVDKVLKAAESGGATPDQIAGTVEKYLAEHPIEETDPTVPEWAKQPEKPSYTAEEVGALPSGTKIPSKTSDLENDSGFTALELDETLTDNTKAAPAGMVGKLKGDLALKVPNTDYAPEEKNDAMTQPVGKDANGKLWTAPVSGGNVDFKTDETLTLKDGILSVNTTDQMAQDNTLPITSAGVYTIVGNIEVLLKTI